MSISEKKPYIKSLKIRNYKSILDLEINFNKSINVFIGENNTGKSNILKCLLEAVSSDTKKFTEISRFNNPTNNKPSITLITSSDTSYNFNYNKDNKLYITNKNRNLHLYNNEADNYLNKVFKYASILNESNNKELIQDIKKYIKEIKNDRLMLKNFISGINRDLAIMSRDHFSMSLVDDEIFICDSFGDTSNIEEKSNGIQKMLIFSYIINKSTILKEDIPHFLFIDEPEIHLHVEAQRHLFSRIKEKFSNSQIFITTHSPVFINDVELDSLFFVQRDIENGTRCAVQTDFKKDFKKINAVLGFNLLDTLSIDTNNSIILVEGHSDKIIHDYLYHRIFPKKKKNFISIEGVDNLFSYLKIYEEILINPPLAIVDYDNQSKRLMEKIIAKNFDKYKYRFYFTNGESLHDFEKKSSYNIEEKDSIVLEDIFGTKFLKSNLSYYNKVSEDNLTFNDSLTEDEGNLWKVLKGNIKNFNKVKYALYTIETLDKLSEDEFGELTKNIKGIYDNLNKYSI